MKAGEIPRFIRRPHHSTGFTLVELLVSLSVLSVVVLIVVLAVNNVKQKASTTLALNRLKGLGQANAAFADDNAGKYVPVFGFDDQLNSKPAWFYNEEFLRRLTGDTGFIRKVEEYEGMDGYPECILDPVTVEAKQRYWSRLSASFGYNQENMPGGDWGRPNTERSHSTYTIPYPARTFQFITATDWTAKYSGRKLWKTKPNEGRTQDGKIAFRHDGRAIAVFYDGHTKALTPEDIERIDSEGGKDHVFWGGPLRP
jgi:prepilin-type N-terminal cleavage/methylation domain-containing protein/prepilin-type processing-associated H-X9-DG protein